MKNVIIALLIAAAGVGVYFFLSKQHQTSQLSSRDLILGKWKIDSLVIQKPGPSSTSPMAFNAVDDSSMRNFEFEFRPDSLFQTYDQKIRDTIHYEFSGSKNIIVWSVTDTAKIKFAIDLLNSSKLVLRMDSSKFFFKRL